MIIHRPASTRGNAKESWINSYRTFSFSGYFNPEHLCFGHLRTINDDRVQPGGHVPMHEHRNMEIFGYVVEGVCRHTDSQGAVLDIPAGGVQRMSTGSGISHTEGNATDTPNRYLQLWIEPNVRDTDPVHEWHHFTREDKLNRFCDVTEKLPIKQDARLLCGIFTAPYDFGLVTSRRYYLYVVNGQLTVNSLPLIEGDGLSFVAEDLLSITAPQESELILFDLV